MDHLNLIITQKANWVITNINFACITSDFNAVSKTITKTKS